jgi:hypothetical protein
VGQILSVVQITLISRPQIYDANPQGGTDNGFWPTNKRNFKTFETARSPVDGGLRNIEIG